MLRQTRVAAGRSYRTGPALHGYVNVNGDFYAVDNECTHLGGDLGEGEMNPDWGDWAIECPLHASVFDVRTGEVLSAPATEPVRTYPVKVEARVVQVSVD